MLNNGQVATIELNKIRKFLCAGKFWACGLEIPYDRNQCRVIIHVMAAGNLVTTTCKQNLEKIDCNLRFTILVEEVRHFLTRFSDLNA